MFQIKNLIPALVIVVGLGIFFGASAFKANQKTTTLKYRFTGTSTADLHNITKWEDVSAEPTPTPCETGTELPCLVEFQNSEFDNIQDFIDQNEEVSDMVATNRVISLKD
ncbi:MAG: hypothetical protein EOO91_18130 [Pedobacter sp.]|nr:MAG: hypothetical protein EOO91_18130 [Pedobacter sp.]